MMETKRERNIRSFLVLLFLVLNLCVIGGMAVALLTQNHQVEDSSGFSGQMGTTEKYTLYIGTNDKDTYTQLIPTEEAREKVNAICTKYVDGYTASEARGGWVDETGTLTQEQTLVYFFYDVTEEQITAIMDEILTELNQNTILVEKETARTMYFAGSGEKAEE